MHCTNTVNNIFALQTFWNKIFIKLKLLKFIPFLLFFSAQLFAQEAVVKNKPEYDDKPLQFGYMLGINTMDFTFGRNYTVGTPPGFPNTLYTDQASKTIGFQVGMVADFRLGEYFNLRILPGFNFGQRNLSFFQLSTDDNGNSTMPMQHVTTFKIESSMLDLPILLKYKAKRINNYRPYVIGGASVRYDLAAKGDFDADVPEYVLLNPFDVFAEMGFGIDYYLPYFKFTTELKLSLGFLNMLNTKTPDDDKNKIYVASLNSLKSNIIMFSVYFQ